MARSFFMPSRSLEFVPDPNHAPGLSRADELARINISVDAEGYVVEGSFSILYDTYVTTSFDGGAVRRVAIKVFKSASYEDDARTEYEMLDSLGGLDGFLPRAVAYGHARSLYHFDRGLPAIMQEFVCGRSVKDIALSPRRPVASSDERFEDVLLMVRAITSAVAAINETAEVRHGDLSHTNVILTRGEGQTYRAVLIDLGRSVLKKYPDIYGRPGTEFFSAPELLGAGTLWREGEYLRVRSSADVYSVGALWVYLLLRANYKSDADFEDDYHIASESGTNGVGRWATPDDVGNVLLASTAGSLIAACMRPDPGERRPLSDVVDDLRCLCTPQLRTEVCLSSILVSANGFHVMGDVLPSPYPIHPNLRIAGRDDELSQVARQLREGRVAYVYGFVGIGTSTLATAFATEALAAGGYQGVGIKRVYLIPFVSSADETLARIAASLNDNVGRRGVTEAADWALNMMEEALWPDDLVILDDVYVPGKTLEEAMGARLARMLSNGRYRLIITSRYPAERDVACRAVRVGGLDDETLKGVFARQAALDAPDDACLLRLFEAVDRNTLVVKLVGGLVKDCLIELEEVVRVLESGRLGNDLIDAFSITDCDSGVQANIRGHVARLLDLTVDALTKDERELMARLLLLPRQGVGIRTLRQVIRREWPSLAAAFSTLRDKGLVERMPQGTRVRLDMLLRGVCLEVEGLTPPLDPHRGFLRELAHVTEEALESGDLETVSDVEAILKTAVDLASEEGLDPFADTLLRRRGEALRALGRSSERLSATARLMDRLGSRGGGAGPEQWAQAVVDHSDALCEFGRYRDAAWETTAALDALGWDETGTDVQARLDGHPRTWRLLVARLLSKRGNATHRLWTLDGRVDLDGALSDKRLAYAILSVEGDEWESAMALIALAYTEYYAGRRERAICDAERAVALVRDSCHSPERERALLYATCLDYLGLFLCDIDGEPPVVERLQESLDVKEEAIRIRYRYLPPIHIDIAFSHNNIAFSMRRIAQACGDAAMHRAALDHALVAKLIRDELRRDGREVASRHVNECILALKDDMGLRGDEVDGRYDVLAIPVAYHRM